MVKNPINLVRNPNSPEAIQARLNNQPDPTVPDKLHLITDNTAGRIFIDLTTEKVDQRVGYIITGGPRALNRRFVRSVIGRDSTGKLTITNYFTDDDKQQWIIIKSYLAEQQLPYEDTVEYDNANPYPRSTIPIPFAGGLFASAPGETWRNQGRSVDKLIAANKRIHKEPPIQPNTNQNTIPVEDEYLFDFTGAR